MSENALVIRPYRAGEERWVADAHKRVYLEEYRWGPSFYEYAQHIALDFAAAKPQEGEQLWVAELNGQAVGSIMLVRSTEEPQMGQVRLFLVEKSARKGGVGSALTDALLQFARESGYKKLMLWTASPLKDAIHHYQRLGFQFVERNLNDSWSLDGEKLYEEKYEMTL
jgi:GNAT superfamily N-acetyltransferase